MKILYKEWRNNDSLSEHMLCVRICWCSSMFIIWMKYELQCWDSVWDYCVFEDLGYRDILRYSIAHFAKYTANTTNTPIFPKVWWPSKPGINYQMGNVSTSIPKISYSIPKYICIPICVTSMCAYMIPLFYHGNNDMFVIYLQYNSIMG